MNGRSIIITIAVRIIFGTNVSVISLIEVAVWKIEMTTPTISDVIKIGSSKSIVVKKMSDKISVISSTVISIKTPY